MKIMLALLAIVLLGESLSANESGIFEATGIYAPKPKPEIVHRQTYSAYRPWYENGRATSDSHLIREHGVSPAKLAGLSHAEKDRLHGMFHGERPRTVSVPRKKIQSPCPNGRCPRR